MSRAHSKKNKNISKKTDYEKIILICMSILTVIALSVFITSLVQGNSKKQKVTPTPTIAANISTSTVTRQEESNDTKLLEVLEDNPDKYISSQSPNRNTFSNENITFDYNPSIFNITYTRAARLLGRLYDFQNIIIISKDKTYTLEMRLNMEGIGGGCPDFPAGYELSDVTLSGRSVKKAKFIDSENAHESWPLGNIYIVDKGEYGYNCPNVAGIHSDKNGASTIVYRLNPLYNNPDEYNKAEKELDEIVASIKGFW